MPDMDEAAVRARRMWRLLEPVHAVTYFTPEARAGFEAAGLRGFWRGYFAGRAAPIGAVGAAPVIAAFFNFAPRMVTRALPAVWDLITPAAALQARTAGAVAALRRLLGRGDAVPAELTRAAGLLAGLTEDLDWSGRPLGGPNAALPVPEEPLARLWQLATVLREHRGDGHVAALVAAGLDGCEALVLRTAVDLAGSGRPTAQAEPGLAGPKMAGPGLTEPGWPREQVQPARGWTDEEWDQAAARLAERGWLDHGAPDHGAPDHEMVATDRGVAAHHAIEQATDRAAARPWARLGAAETEQLAAGLATISSAAAAVLPVPNPSGIAAPPGPPVPGA